MRSPDGARDDRVLPVHDRVRPPREHPGDELRIGSPTDQVPTRMEHDRDAEKGHRDYDVGQQCDPGGTSRRATRHEVCIA